MRPPGHGGTAGGGGVIGYAGFAAALLAILMAVTALPGFAGIPTEVSGILLFLGVLPLVNGVFDYVSYGITLTLIRAGWSRGTWVAVGFGIADAGIALILFTALGATLIAMVAAMNTLAGATVYDLSGLFADLRDPVARNDYWWLYAMLFSTALPTLAHLCLASLSLQGIVPHDWRARLLPLMDRAETDLPAKILYHGSVATLWTVTSVLPVFVIGGVVTGLWQYADVIGGTYLQIFEYAAGWLGQIERTGPGALPGHVWV